MMSKEVSHQVYMVDIDRRAEPARDTTAFADYRDYQARIINLFTLREAVPDVQKLIMQSFT